MVRGQYMAATGMMLQRRKMEAITNNLTNVETAGYKKNHLVSYSFEDVLIRRRQNLYNIRQDRGVGPLNFGTRVDQVFTDYSEGYLEETHRTTDMALTGDGFFVVDTPAGQRYTRAGTFVVTRDGYLTDHDGNFLLGTNGRIFVGNDQFTVDLRGNVSVGGERVNTVLVAAFEDNNELRKQGDNLYDTEAVPQNAQNYEIRQGFLENSNVNAAREMVDMITVYRAYESNQKMLTMIDEIVGKAVNDIGRLR